MFTLISFENFKQAEFDLSVLKSADFIDASPRNESSPVFDSIILIERLISFFSELCSDTSHKKLLFSFNTFPISNSFYYKYTLSISKLINYLKE